MPKIPHDSLSEGAIRLAGLAKAMAHPARIRILQILAERRACICGQIVDELPYSQSTVSQHLKELKKAGLIRGEIDGPRTCYCLDQEVLVAAWKSFGELFANLECCPMKGETHEIE